MAQHEFKDTKNGLRENANKKNHSKKHNETTERTNKRMYDVQFASSFVQNWQPKERTLQKNIL